jgi:N-acetylglutamate synthase-like GNAT family acetyltransferase
MKKARVRDAAPADLPAVLALLAEAGLPAHGVAEAFADFVVAESGDHHRLVGAAGLELHGGHALLRSVVVANATRGTGVGAALVDAALERARRRGCSDVYLLTTTAEGWFPRLGFARIERAAVPAPLFESVEFREACPASAAVMMRSLDGP